MILGIIVRSKQRSRHLRASSTEQAQLPTVKSLKKLPTALEDLTPTLPETVPDRSYTPPLPEKEHESSNKKDPRLKRKIRVQIDYNKSGKFKNNDFSKFKKKVRN